MTDWPGYLEEFHRRRSGITEATLGRCTSGGIDPYTWLLDPLVVDNDAPVLDLACGSGPLVGRRPASPWIGVDRSAAELATFAAPGVRADAGRLPFRSGTFPNVVCSMAVMLLRPLDAALAEIHRVLTPGGRGALLVPGGRPLTARDVARYGRLMIALRRTHLTYPNRGGQLLTALAGAGLAVTSDERRRFELPLDDPRLFVESLYLPGSLPARIDAAARVTAGWEGIGIPLRRVVFDVGAGL